MTLRATATSKNATNAVEHISLEEFQQFWEQHDNPNAGQDLQDFVAFSEDIFDDRDISTATSTAVVEAEAVAPPTSIPSQTVPSVDQLLGQVSNTLRDLNNNSTQQTATTYNSIIPRYHSNTQPSTSSTVNCQHKAPALNAQVNRYTAQ
jgi:hypothetical protein